MATNPTGGPSVPLLERVKNILLTPKTEWPRIDAEPATIGGIYRNYVIILAAIPPIAMAIGLLLLGYGLFSPAYILGTAIVQYLLSLVSVYVLALIVDALAPTFGGSKDQVKAFKVTAYCSTAAWVAGAAYIVPQIGWLIGLIGGIYSLYLLYLGLPVLMKVAGDKVLPYFVVTIVAAILLWWLAALIVGSVVAAIVGMPGPGPVIINVPG